MKYRGPALLFHMRMLSSNAIVENTLFIVRLKQNVIKHVFQEIVFKWVVVMPITLELGRMKQEDHEFEVSLSLEHSQFSVILDDMVSYVGFSPRN